MVLDENLPTYRFKTSSDNPLTSLLYYTHRGSEPSADYLLKRPPPSKSHNQYALGLFDVQYSSVLFAEALIKPEWSQPTLSAAEVRANGGTPVSVPQTPQSFSVSLYNPDQTVAIKYVNGSWSKDSWEFEVPQRSFKLPSSSKIDQDAPDPVVADLIPKVVFRWKRDGRMSRDMTCYMSGKTVGGQKNKEPDITVALFKGGKTEGTVAIYEPNMARVEVEDRKGLEVVLLLSAEIIRDLYLAPRVDPFNTSGASAPNAGGQNSSTSPGPSKNLQKQPTAPLGAATMSGALGNITPSTSQQAPGKGSSGTDPRRKADVDAEKRRVQALVEQEKEKARERERRDREEQERIRKMLESEEREEKERRRKAVEEETERLRKEYGVQGSSREGRPPPDPALPPRPVPGGAVMSGGGGGWFGGANSRPPQPPRPQSVGPPVVSSSNQDRHQKQQPPQQPQPGNENGGGRRQKFGQFLQNSPYAGPAAASVSGFFGSNSGGGGGGGGGNSKEEEKRKKARKKRSVHF